MERTLYLLSYRGQLSGFIGTPIWSRLANWSWRFHNKFIEILIRPIENYKVTDPIKPEFELVQDFMPVLVTIKFHKDSNKG